MRRGTLTILASGVLAAAALPALAQHDPPPCLPFETIAQGSQSAFDPSPGCDIEVQSQCPGTDLVIEDRATWTKFWAKHWANFIPPPPLPAIDFREQVVLASFLGERRTTYYASDIECVREIGIAGVGTVPLTVEVLDVSPGPNCVVNPTLTNPYHIVVLDRPTGPFGERVGITVTFDHDDYVIPCGGGDDPICVVCGPGGGNGDVGQGGIPCCP